MGEWIASGRKNGTRWTLVADGSERGQVEDGPEGWTARTSSWRSDGHWTVQEAARALLLHLDPTAQLAADRPRSEAPGLSTAEIVAFARGPANTAAAALQTIARNRTARARRSLGSAARGTARP